MDFAFNEQQDMLQKSARDFLNTEYSDKLLKEIAKEENGHNQELWSKMADLGWMALSIPESCGGIGDFLDLTIILEEMGRAGLISPYFSTMVLGASTICLAGNDEQKQKLLPAIAEGKFIVTLALTESSGKFTPDAIQTQAVPGQRGYVINGTKLFVPDANSAGVIIFAARTKESPLDISLFLVESKIPGISINPLKTISGEKMSQITFNQVSVPQENVLGQAHQGWNYIEKVLDRAAVARCAEAVGGAKRVLDMTLTYAKERIAFGHPIGAYQSIQHRCADMLIDLETSRLVTYQAAWSLNEGLTSQKEVAAAKAWVGQAYRRIVTSAHQVYGAIGFTEDHILHWYTRKARAVEFTFGGEDYQLKRLASSK
jgi:3-oxocholest-4-en-26-oyl-CoA dehydrogenase beta subunit